MTSHIKSLLSKVGLNYLFTNLTNDGQFDISEYRNPDSYDLETRKIIETITIGDNINPVGSQKYKVHRYPGDIDIFEPVKVCCSLEEASNKIVKSIQEMVKEIKSEPKYFLGDFKAGLDNRYQIDLKQSPDKITRQLMVLRRGQLLTSDEVGNMLELLQNKRLDELKEVLRKYSVIRWNEDELLAGSKTLKGGLRLTLKDAIRHPTIVKLDLWAPVNGDYTEITNFLLLMYIDDHGREHTINLKLADRITSLIGDIKLYSSHQHLKSLKVAKRMWALAQAIDDQETLEKLYPLFSSDAASLSQITSEIETLIMMLTKLSKPPMEMMIRQIDRFKSRIGRVFIKINENEIFEMINTITRMYFKEKDALDRDLVIKLLRTISEKITSVVEQYSHDYLIKVDLWDPNHFDYLLKHTLKE